MQFVLGRATVKPTVCPTDDSLRRIVEGGDSDDQLRFDEDHVMECGDCLGRLKALMAQTSDSWPKPAQGEQPAEAALVDRLLSMRAGNATWATDSTPGDPTHPGDFVPPPQLGPFQLGQLLGAGGVGLVYEAHDTELQRKVAVKILRPEHARKPVSRRRFLDEARAAAALSSDHIVPIYRVGEDGDSPYIAMPRLEGRSLADELKTRTKLPISEAIDVAHQVALGLQTAHDRGLIHRDIKPGNIWLEPNGRVKIVDFGLARFMDSDIRLTQTGLIVGTPAYMAPEQADDGLTVDHRADLFSLGCVMYQMLAGRTPFAGTSALAVFKAMAAGDAPHLSKLDPQTPERLSSLVAALLERDPKNRPASADEVLRELQNVHEPLARPRWSRRRVLQSLGAAALAGGGLAGWTWYTYRPQYRSELYLPAGSSAWVQNQLMDPRKTSTVECWFTPLQQYPDATHVIGNTSFLIFGGKGPEGANSFHLSVALRKPPEDAPVEERRHFVGAGLFEPGRRIHLAIADNGANFSIFIDGKLAAAQVLRPYLSLVPSTSFLLGAVNSAIDARYGEVRISSIARYVRDFVPAERHETDEHTIALYHCDESAGYVLTDSSGRGNHGAVHGKHEWVRTPRGP